MYFHIHIYIYIYEFREKCVSLKFLALCLDLAVKRICEEVYEKQIFAFLQHLSPEYLKALYTKERIMPLWSLLNPRGICSMEWPGDLSQVVTGGFLT